MLDTFAGQVAARISDALTLCMVMVALLIIFQAKYEKKRVVFALLIGDAAGMGLILLMEKISDRSFWFYVSCFIIIGVAFARVMLEGDFIPQLILLVVLVTAAYELSFLEEWTLRYLFPRLPAYRAVLIQPLLIFILFINRRLLQKGAKINNIVPYAYCFVIICTSFLSLITSKSFLSMGIHLYTPEDMQIRFSISISTFLINLLVFYIYNKLAVLYSDKLELQRLNSRLYLEKSVAIEAERMSNHMKKTMHDIKNHIGTVRTLAAQNATEALLRYLDEIITSLELSGNVNTGNLVVDAILAHKMGLAEDKGVVFAISSSTKLASDITVSTYDICALLSNLIDNAIEATAQCPTPRIDLLMQIVKNYIVIQISNHTAGNELISNPHLATTKSDARNHGLGLFIIQDIVKKYDGDLKISVSDSVFCVDVMLRLS